MRKKNWQSVSDAFEVFVVLQVAYIMCDSTDTNLDCVYFLYMLTFAGCVDGSNGIDFENYIIPNREPTEIFEKWRLS